MFMRELLAAAILICTTSAYAEDAPRLGDTVSAKELADADFVVMPNGEGLPAGSGTATDGAAVFATYCLACHGENGVGGANDRLAGGHGSLTGANPQKTVGSYWPYATTVFDYIRRAMPYQAPGSLSDDEVYALTAFILYINDIVEENDELDAQTLPGVSMPNRDNFVWDYRP